MPRAGLNTDVVVAAALTLADETGLESLSLATLAGQFGVRPPSLYNHVGGLADLERRMALRSIEALTDALRVSVMGRSGEDAFRALANAYRSYALDHPGTYPLTQVAHPEDPELSAAGARAIEPVLAVLEGYGLDDEAAVHAVRAVRSALHGFVLLETRSGFGMDMDVDASFARLVATLEAGLRPN